SERCRSITSRLVSIPASFGGSVFTFGGGGGMSRHRIDSFTYTPRPVGEVVFSAALASEVEARKASVPSRPARGIWGGRLASTFAVKPGISSTLASSGLIQAWVGSRKLRSAKLGFRVSRNR